MPDLQTTYYVMAILFMSLALVIAVVMAVALVVIRNKITAIHRNIDEKLMTLSQLVHLAEKGGEVFGAIKKATESAKK